MPFLLIAGIRELLEINQLPLKVILRAVGHQHAPSRTRISPDTQAESKFNTKSTPSTISKSTNGAGVAANDDLSFLLETEPEEGVGHIVHLFL